MSDSQFYRQVERLCREIEEKLDRRSTAGPGPSRAEALEDLRTCLEELKVAEEELQKQNDELATARQRYQELFDFAPDAYLVTDPEGIIQEANHAAVKLLRLPNGFIAGKPLLSFVAVEHHKDFLALVTRLRRDATEKVENWEITLQSRVGESLQATVTVGAARDRLSCLIGIRWLIRVITLPLLG